MRKKTWIKRDLMAKYPIGTPVAYLLGYYTSKPNTAFGVVTGYDNEVFRSTWAINITRCDGKEFQAVPDSKGSGRYAIITQEDLESLEAKFKKSTSKSS
jgi:hypothetical protein